MALIYLDHHATTPVDPTVAEAMLPFFSVYFGNPSSRHRAGRMAGDAVTAARESLAAAIGAKAGQITFTSGATEANNLALQALARSCVSPGHLVTTAIEHPSVLEVCRVLESDGWALTIVPCSNEGLVDPNAIEAALTPETLAVSMMAVNNEVGTLQPVREVGSLCREHGVVFHCDAAQALGRIPIEVGAWAADLVTLSAHKAYGPKGVGALVIGPRARRRLRKGLTFGGGQERGLRPGTLNVPGIVGFGEAARLAAAALGAGEPTRLAGLRDQLLVGLRERVGGIEINGSLGARLAGNLNVSLDGVAAEVLLVAVEERVAVSSGSACSEADGQGSHVLRAMGLPERRVHCAVRFGLGRYNTRAEVDEAIEIIAAAAAGIRRQGTSAGAGAVPPSY
jgi:cysteine desulfurase